jgi:hypothetical protein
LADAELGPHVVAPFLKWHVSPSGRHAPPLQVLEVGLRQIPGVVAVAPWHVTVPAPGRPVLQASPPQQSLSFRQRSPSTWQPLAGWQMLTPVRNGAHTRLQQPVQLLQTVPSTPPQLLAPEGG